MVKKVRKDHYVCNPERVVKNRKRRGWGQMEKGKEKRGIGGGLVGDWGV